MKNYDPKRKITFDNFMEDIGLDKTIDKLSSGTKKEHKLILKTTNDKIISKIKKNKYISRHANKIEAGAKIIWSTIKGICAILLIIYLSLNIQYIAEYGSIVKCFNGLTLTNILFPSDESKYPYTSHGFDGNKPCQIADSLDSDKFNFKLEMFSKLHSCSSDGCPAWPYKRCKVPTCTTSVGNFCNLIFIDSFYDAELMYNKFVSTMLYLLNLKHINFLPVFIFYLAIVILFIIALTHVMPVMLTVLQIRAFILNSDLWNSILYVKLMFIGFFLIIIFIIANFLYTIWKIVTLLFKLTIEPTMIGANISHYLSKYCIVILIIVGLYVAIKLMEYSSAVL